MNKSLLNRVGVVALIAGTCLTLSGCDYMPYWAGHDMGASVGPSTKSILDSYEACVEWSYNDGYPDNEDYIRGCQDAWEGN